MLATAEMNNKKCPYKCVVPYKTYSIEISVSADFANNDIEVIIVLRFWVVSVLP